jgi:hypothetical protein
MSYQNISAVLANADKTAVQDAIQTIKSKLPFLISFNALERKNIRKMGAVRTSYVQDVYTASIANSASIPPALSLDEYTKDFNLLKEMNEIISNLMPVYESVQDTYLALGNELMKQSDEAYSYLKNAAKKNSSQALTMTVKQISDQLKTGKREIPAKEPELN